jgi:hypothetical protein
MKLNIEIISCLILLFFVSCTSNTENTNSSIKEVPFFDEQVFFEIRDVVSKDWSLTQDSSNVILITKSDSIEICNFINSDMLQEENYEEWIKNKIIDKVQYQLKYIFTEKLTNDEIKTIEATNDSIDNLSNLLLQKHNVANLSRKYDDFIPRNDTDKININNYMNEKNELMKLYQKLPDYKTIKYDVYISDNLPWYGSICMPDIESDVYDLKERIKKLLQKKEMKHEIKTNFTCNNYSCLEENKNSKGIIEGVLRKYTPNKVGKGANQMFWDWELLLADSIAIPVVDENKTIEMSSFENRNVSIYGNIFYGVIIGGSSNIEEQEQSASGYRIDAISLQTKLQVAEK